MQKEDCAYRPSGRPYKVEGVNPRRLTGIGLQRTPDSETHKTVGDGQDNVVDKDDAPLERVPSQPVRVERQALKNQHCHGQG